MAISPGVFVAIGSATAVAILLYRQRAEAAAPISSTGPGGVGWKGDPVERPRVHQPIFADSREGHREFVRYLRAALTNIGFTHSQALLFIAHKARESGYGKSIWNYNFGNIKTGSPVRGPYFWMTDRRGFRDKYRAYDTPEDGIWNNVDLVRRAKRYRKSWSMLTAEDPNWYGQLGLDGYYEGPPDPAKPGQHTNHTPATIIPVQAEYNSILASVKHLDAETAA
jgi:hypothetical protein